MLMFPYGFAKHGAWHLQRVYVCLALQGLLLRQLAMQRALYPGKLLTLLRYEKRVLPGTLKTNAFEPVPARTDAGLTRMANAHRTVYGKPTLSRRNTARVGGVAQSTLMTGALPPSAESARRSESLGILATP